MQILGFSNRNWHNVLQCSQSVISSWASPLAQQKGQGFQEYDDFHWITVIFNALRCVFSKMWSLCEKNLIILLLLQLIQIVLPYSISVSLYSCLHSVEQSWGSQTIHHMTAYAVHRGEGWICCIATHRKVWNSITGITTKFCTWHDSYAVISCAKICSDLITHNLITIKFFFSYIFLVHDGWKCGRTHMHQCVHWKLCMHKGSTFH